MSDERTRACPLCQTVFTDDGLGRCPSCGTPIEASADEPTQEWTEAEDEAMATGALTPDDLADETHLLDEPVHEYQSPTEMSPSPTEVLPPAQEADVLDTLVARGLSSSSRSRSSSSRSRRRRKQEIWYRKPAVLAAAAAVAVIVLIAVIAALSRNDPETIVITSPTPSATVLQVVPTVAPPTVAPTLSPQVTGASTPGATPAPGTWTQVTTLSGTGPSRGGVFELTGREARLRYTLQGDANSTLTVYVVPEGRTVEPGSDAPVVNQQGQAESETRLQKGAGRYYLDVSSSGGSWTVTIEELR